MKPVPSGCLIAGVGIPAAGKTSVLRRTSAMNGWRYWAEPEEAEWPEAISMQSDVGNFTAISCFRAMRIPKLYDAKACANAGAVAVIDSYYDVLMSRYLEAPDMDWLISRQNPYFDLTVGMARLDHLTLPKADVMVFFRVTFPTWERLVASRRRYLDMNTVFPSAFAFQETLLSAAKLEALSSKTSLFIYEQEYSSIEESAAKLSEQLRSHLVSKTIKNPL
ncbi:MAG: hypothetical protein JNN07_21980 [Verrucomicrobiales bacterium]|nr:hypothetical protein [Verrucomicrobiales bacterium]